MKRQICAAFAVIVFIFCGFSAIASTREAAEASWWNILLLGGDSRDTEGYERTDANIILSVNIDDGRVKMTSIMRDTWVDFPNGYGSGKINAANVFDGPQLMIDTVNECFDAKIEDYILINMTDLVYIIDRIDGIDLEITESERCYVNDYAKLYLKELKGVNSDREYEGDTSLEQSGLVHLNGLLAMSYCRDRYSDNDYGRVMRQQKVLLAMAEQMQNMEINDLMAMADDVLATVETNLSDEELERLAKMALMIEVDEVQQLRIPADGTFRSGMVGNTWRIDPDFEANAEILHEFIYGKCLQ